MRQVYYCYVYSEQVGFPVPPHGRLTDTCLCPPSFSFPLATGNGTNGAPIRCREGKKPPANQWRAQRHTTVINCQSSSAQANELRGECKCGQPQPIGLTTDGQDYVMLFKMPNRINSCLVFVTRPVLWPCHWYDDVAGETFRKPDHVN